MNPSAWSLPKRSGSAGGWRRRPLADRVATALAAVATTGVAALSLAAAPALADDCPNAAARAQNNSTHLPDCRAYEQVTPPFKEAFAPGVPDYTDDGGGFAYQSAGQFAGVTNGGTQNQYVATRSAIGWTTAAPGPSPSLYANVEVTGGAFAMSADLGSSVWQMARAGESSEVLDLYRRGPDGVFTRIGPALNPATRPPASPGGPFSGAPAQGVSGSRDLSHVMFFVAGSQAFPGAGVSTDKVVLYQYDGVGHDAPQQVGVDNDGQPIASCNSIPGSTISAYRAMSLDGRVIFWSTQCQDGFLHVWARVSATTTFDVSASQCARTLADSGGLCNAPASVTFEGANAAGTRVYFTTTQQLVNDDTDQTSDLYACDLPTGTPGPIGLANPCPELSRVSGSATGADVQGVVRVSDDGSRVYFVAQGVLAANLGANDLAAAAGEDNLYVWRKDGAHPGGQTTFVGKLDPADSALWGTESFGGRMAQTTDDGRYLVLSTYAPLVASGPSADSDTDQDVYRYDADAGSLARLSTATSGDGGNAPGHSATIAPIVYPYSWPTARSRTAMTSDGGVVVFRTDEVLSPADDNGVADVYAWHDGHVSLISGGQRSFDDLPSPPTQGLVTASGHDIYFSTTAQLTPSDGDTQVDFYDARMDGGFPVTQPMPCSGDGCQGALSAAPGSTAPVSEALTGRSDVSQVAPTFSLDAVSLAQRKKLASTGKLTLKVTANTPASLAARATATVARKPGSVASARHTLARPGTASLTLTLSAAARAQLAADGKLTVKVVVSDSKVATTRSITLKLTRAKSKKASKGKPVKKVSVGRAAISKGVGHDAL